MRRGGRTRRRLAVGRAMADHAHSQRAKRVKKSGGRSKDEVDEDRVKCELEIDRSLIEVIGKHASLKIRLVGGGAYHLLIKYVVSRFGQISHAAHFPTLPPSA